MSSLSIADYTLLKQHADKLLVADRARFTLNAGANCFLMLLGFALLEAGSLRAKNLSAVMLKQFIVTVVVTLVWYLWGHGVAFGATRTDVADPNNFIGTARAALHDVHHNDNKVFSNWFFQMTFCAVSCSIVSGAIGERLKFPIYLVFLFLMAGWIYPVVAYAQWSTHGWNSPFNSGNATSHLGDKPFVGVLDAAGCGPVHMVGGICAFMGAWLCGPRRGRFNLKTREPIPIPGHNSAYVTMGVMILWFGWFGFTSNGRTFNELDHYKVVGRTTVNLMLSSAVAGFTVLLYKSAQTGFKVWPLTASLNGVLTGCVAVTSGCFVLEPWGAFVAGICAGFTCIFLSHVTIAWLKVDDPVDATAVHFGGGLLGLTITGLLASGEAVRVAYGPSVSDDYAGALMGGNGKMLGYQLVAAVFITVWSSFFSFVYYFACLKIFGLRYSEADEEAGLDAKLFGGDGYDYLSPMDQVKVLDGALTSLRSTLADGAPEGAVKQGDKGVSTSTTTGSGANSLQGSFGSRDEHDHELEDVEFGMVVVQQKPSAVEEDDSVPPGRQASAFEKR